MGFKQLFVFTALLLLWKVCKVHGQGARVEYVNQPYCGAPLATAVQTTPQVVVPALYKPACDYIQEPAPIVPSFNGYSGITGYAPSPNPGFFPGFPGPMPPIIVDDDDDDNFHHLLYFLIFAMRNRRCGGYGGYGGYGGGCNGGCGGNCGGGCNGGYSGYNGCSGNCGGSCGGSCGGGCGTGCNSCGFPYPYPFSFPTCGCPFSGCGCSDTSYSCGCADDCSCSCQGANEITLLIKAADCNNNNCNGCYTCR